MTETDGLREYVPESCQEMVELSDDELKTELPKLARDTARMGEVEQAVKSLPSNHELHRADARDSR